MAEKLSGLSPNLQSFYNELYGRFPTAYVTSGKRSASQGVGKASKTSRHNVGQAMDLRHDPAIVSFLNTPEGARLLSTYGLGFLDEGSPEMLKKTGGTGAHIHIGMDSKLAAAAKQRAGQGSPMPQTQLAQAQSTQSRQPAVQPTPVFDLHAALYGDAQQQDLAQTAPVNFNLGQPADFGVDYTKYFG